MSRILLLTLLVSGCFFLYGQNQTGNVTIFQDARVDSLLKMHIEINKKNPNILGWRINIFFETGNNSKKLALEAKAAFVQNHANVPCYLVFQEPYYKVRVGDYRSQLEAEKFLRQLANEYPNAFVVEDDINYPNPD